MRFTSSKSWRSLPLLAVFALVTLFTPVKIAVAAVPPFNDVVHLYPIVTVDEDAWRLYWSWYQRYTAEGLNFFYQLCDVSGERGTGHTLAGAQWFATIHENYFWNYYYRYDDENTDIIARNIYRRTLGGETPEISMYVSADLLNDMNHVFVREPEQYQKWLDFFGVPSNIHTNPYWTMYDNYMDPVESVCLVIPEGQGTFKVDFGNHYARHFPYWYGPEDQEVLPFPGVIVSGDSLYSGDIDGDPASWEVVGSRDIIEANEDIKLVMSEADADSYNIEVTPSVARRVKPGEYLPTTVRLTANDTDNYGSRIGYLSFRQSASFDKGYTGWRESVNIPLVVANVHDGPASDPGNELYFDVVIFEKLVRNASADLGYEYENPVNRIQFRWDANSDLTKELGTIYMMDATSDDRRYPMEIRVTNRTGTRYRMQRYDRLSSGSNSFSYKEVYPNYWKYDLTPDRYGSLPPYFQLDPQSQIAPGLVSVYSHNLNISEDRTLNTGEGTNALFRLHTFDNPTPHSLTLTYTRVEGLDGIKTGNAAEDSSARWRVQPFSMNFSDVIPGSNRHVTIEEISADVGLPPVIVPNGGRINEAYSRSINKDALSGFELSCDVSAVASYDVISYDVTSSDASTSSIASSTNIVYKNFAVQPARIRFCIARTQKLLNDRWDELVAAAEISQERLLKTFADFGTIWVRSENAKEIETNLFTARNGKTLDCIRAFLYEDELYLDMIVFLADAVSPNKGKGPFCYIFTDDEIPYILLGDGKQDGIINFTFFVGEQGDNPKIEDPEETVTTNKNDEGGGGCSAGLGITALAVLALAIAKGKFE